MGRPPPSALFLAAAFLALQLGLGLAFIRSAAATYDEPIHLASGYTYLATGRYRLNIMHHPPLAEMWPALPLLALRPHVFLSHPTWLQGEMYGYADYFLYHNRIPAERLLNAARVFALLSWSALLAWGLWGWARRLGGWRAAVGAAAAAALCPALVSNLALITTDAAAAVLYFLSFYLLSGEGKGRWAGAGLCAGLALASKFSMIALLPVAGACLLLEWFLRPRPRPPLPWGGFLAFCACAAAALAAVYRLDLALYWAGLSDTMSRLEGGRSSFLLGRHSTTGFWLYFPVALAVKLPLPLLLLGFGEMGLRLKRRERGFLCWAAAPMAAYFALALSAKVQIGFRHLLPALPFLILAAGCGAARLWEGGSRGRAAAAFLGAWLALSTFRVAPHLLAYFNELAGGPRGGLGVLVDSNLDWGQELKGLSRAVRELGDPPIYLSYFGTADPSAYGLRYLPVASVDTLRRRGDEVDPAAFGRVLFAVSATNLQAVYLADKGLFGWLKERRPLRTIGYSIFLYDLTGDPEGRRRLASLVAASGFPGRAKTLLIQ